MVDERDQLWGAARRLIEGYMAGDEQGWLASFNRLEDLTGGNNMAPDPVVGQSEATRSQQLVDLTMGDDRVEALNALLDELDHYRNDRGVYRDSLNPANPVNEFSAALDGRMTPSEAQAWGYRQIVKLILLGEADREPDKFLGKVKMIAQQASEKGA